MNLVEARGGIAALSSNWRLELMTFLWAPHFYFFVEMLISAGSH